MKQFRIVPSILEFNTCEEFASSFEIGKNDLIFISERTYNKFFKDCTTDATIIFRGSYGSGEPTDEMAEAIYQDIKDIPYTRVIAIGGGTIIDTAKLFALKTFSPVLDLFDKKIEAIQDKELLLVPTTCGTGSEVTNISILELVSRNTKLGLAVDALYPSHAVLIPQLLEDLPFEFFATSSIDALIHAVESFLSPKATTFSQMYSREAIKMILTGYQEIAKNGKTARFPILKEFMLASTYAGIAFGNAGTGAVHAMSYPLGAKYHVPHGESNYALFTEVFKLYQKLDPNGNIQALNELVSSILICNSSDVYEEIEKLLDVILPKKPLHSYGTTLEDLDNFTENVMTKQGRLMANNYTVLDKDMVYGIYSRLF
ncbi:MAG: 4-hydroxybutyrate dehydrogenase [Lachnotalea sp.]